MNMFKYELKLNCKTVLIWLIVCIGILLFLFAMFPLMELLGIQELIDNQLSQMPPEMQEIMGGQLNLTDLCQYFSSEFLYMVMAFCIFAGILGANALAREEYDGSIEFLYAKPVTRTQILTAKLTARFVLFTVFLMILTVISLGMGYVVRNDQTDFSAFAKGTLLMHVGAYIAGLFFLAVGMLISSTVKKGNMTIGLIIGIFFVTYIIGSASGLMEELRFLEWFAPAYYANPVEVMSDGLEPLKMAVLLVASVGAVALSYRQYNKKDFYV